MKKILSLLLFIFLQLSSKSQTLNFLDKADFNNDKKTIVYTYTSWCGENIDDFNSIKDTLKKYRNNYNLQIISDTSDFISRKIYKDIVDLKPDKVISLSEFFPRKLRTNSEMKLFSNYLNSFFNDKKYQHGPSTLIMHTKNGTSVLLLTNRLSDLSNFLKSP